MLLREIVFHADHVVDRAALEVADDDDAARRRQGDDGEQRLAGAALQLAPDHPRRLAEMAGEAEALQQGAAEAVGRGRAHRLGDGFACGDIDGAAAAEERGEQADHRPHRDGLRVEAELQIGEVEVDLIKRGEALPQPHARRRAENNAGEANQADDEAVMRRHLRRAVAKGLEYGDLVALHADQALEHHIEQEGGDGEEDGREHPGQCRQLAEFFVQHAVRHLLHAVGRAGGAIAGEEAVNGGDDCLRVRAGGEAESGFVERAFHVERGGERPLRQPQHGVAQIIREHRARANEVKVFGGGRRADDGEALLSPINYRLQRIARLQAVRLRKRRADEHLARQPRRGQAAALQQQAVLPWRAVIRQRLHPRFRRFGKTVERQLRARHQPRLHLGHPGNLGEPRQHRLRHPLRLHPNLGKARLAIKRIARIA